MNQHQPRRFLRPRFEGLEARVVLSNIGVNLDSNSAWVGNPIWVDVHNLFNPWQPGTNPWTEAPEAAVNADNYPLETASTLANMQYYPDGDYQMSYQGQATISFFGIGTLVGPVVTNSSGVSTGTVLVDHNSGQGVYLNMIVSNLSAADPLSNFHLYTPGYGSNPTQMFTNQFLHQLQPFSTIRFMNWIQTNDSTVSTWQQRTSPNSILATTSTGIPFEDMIELANEAHKNMWINIPALATADYVENLAQLIKSNLDPGLYVYVEYSNETWNYGFSQFDQILNAAASNPLVDAQTDNVRVAEQSAYELVSIAKTFDQVFGSSSNLVKPIIGGWAAIYYIALYQLEFITDHYGAPSQYVAGVAIALIWSCPTVTTLQGSR